nr:Dihydrofolate reductase [uncultured bacterium]
MIVAYSKNHVIGRGGKMPWQGEMPGDAQHFRELSTGKTIIMGRKTYESIGHALPNRQNIVVSLEPFNAPDALVVHSLADAYGAAENEIAIIGGGQIYAAALEDADIVYATEINAEFEDGDTFFPVLSAEWQETAREDHKADEKNRYDYSFITYKKVDR